VSRDGRLKSARGALMDRGDAAREPRLRRR
jgi:hypothetical protein